MADKVYYNSACPVCNAGIKGQRRRMEACGIADVEWVDIHSTPEAVEEVGAALEEVRERLYVKDANGQLHIGADAFAHLSSRTHGQRWLAMLVQLPVLRQLARLVYNSLRAFCIAGIAPRAIGNGLHERERGTL
jgi:predicted DCC family thiol-disulfide oxidoreductase YuxK